MKADNAGNLKTTKEQKVEKQTVTIIAVMAQVAQYG